MDYLLERYEKRFELKEKNYEKYEGLNISYKGLDATIENVFSYGIEIVYDNGSDLLDFKDFDTLLKNGSIELL